MKAFLCILLMTLMLSIYILILNYDFVSFLVFWSHFFMLVFCIFLVGYKGYESARNEAEKPKKWMQTVSQGREYSLQQVPISL